MIKQCILIASALMVGVFSSSLMAHEGHEHDSVVAQLQVTHAQVREFLPATKASVAYFSIKNYSNVPATLTRATIDGLGRVEIHEHVHADGMMKMQKVESLLIKAHQQLDFKPGSYHLMVFEPQEPLKVGQERKLTLYFEDGNRVFTNAKVVSLASQAEPVKASKDHSHH